MNDAALPPGFALDAPAMAALPPGFAVDPPHAVSGPSGDWLTDAGRFLGTAATRAGLALADPLVRTFKVDPNAPQPGQPGFHALPQPSDYVQPGQAPANRQAAADAVYNGLGTTEYQPPSYVGRRAMDATTGAIAAAATGNPAAVLPAAGGSVTAGGASELFPNHPLIASLLGFLPGAKLATTAGNVPGRIAALSDPAAVTEPYGAFQRQGLPTSLAGTTTGEPGLQYAEKFAARMPGSEASVAHARGQLLDAWQQRFNQVAGRLGAATTPQEAGQSLQSAAQNWLTNFKNTTGQLWQDFYTKVPETTPVDVTNYKAALNRVLSDYPGAPATGAALRPPPAARLQQALASDTAPPRPPQPTVSSVVGPDGQPLVTPPSVQQLQQYQAAAANSGKLPWEAVKNIRSAVGAMIENPQTVSDIPQASLRQIYKGLTQDMQSGAASVSPDALTAFHKANAATAAGHDLLENYLDPVLKATNPEEAARYALSQARLGGSRVGALTFNLPGAAGDLGALALRQAATNTESPTALATAILGRKPVYSPEAMNTLFPNASDRADIADMATVGRAMQPLEKDLANSPTATHQTRGIGRLITALEMSKEGHELAGTPGRIGGLAMGLMAPNVLGRVAQATALNPYLAAMYGRNPALRMLPPSPLARALIPQAVMSQPGAPAAALPATSASSAQQ